MEAAHRVLPHVGVLPPTARPAAIRTPFEGRRMVACPIRANAQRSVYHDAQLRKVEV